LPLSSTQLANLLVQAITPAVGNQLLPHCFQPPLSEHFDDQPSIGASDFNTLLALTCPLAQLKQQSSSKQTAISTDSVSVVVCTRDRPQQLARCLQSLLKLSPGPQEIIVVDNAPTTTDTRQLVSEMPNIRYVAEASQGLSVARNTGIDHSQEEIVVFTDDDVTVHSNWLSRLIQNFQDSQVMAITGLVLPTELETEAQIIFELGLGSFGWGYQAKRFDQDFFQATKPLGVPVWRIGAGANMAFRREIFEQVGFFNEQLGAGASGCSEDSELWYRILTAGWACYYEPSAVVFHHHRQDMTSLKHQMFNYMRGHVVALLVQFARYKHWGNIRRLVWSLPFYYAGLLKRGLFEGFEPRHKTLMPEILGCLAGIKFYLQHR
jgi:GT2 family glycosyltransferase